MILDAAAAIAWLDGEERAAGVGAAMLEGDASINLVNFAEAVAVRVRDLPAHERDRTLRDDVKLLAVAGLRLRDLSIREAIFAGSLAADERDLIRAAKGHKEKNRNRHGVADRFFLATVAVTGEPGVSGKLGRSEPFVLRAGLGGRIVPMEEALSVAGTQPGLSKPPEA